VVLVGGGIAAFAIVGGEKNQGGGDGPVAAADAAEPSAADAMVAGVADAGAPPPADAEVVAQIDAAEPPKVDAGLVIPDTVQILIKSRYHPTFEVWENDRKLFDGPENLPVPAGETRKVTIKARGYKDKTIIVASTTKGGKIELGRLASIPGTGPGSSRPPPPDPGCKNMVADPDSPACRKQYCQFHPEDKRCLLE
jgi:hypothetical protein